MITKITPREMEMITKRRSNYTQYGDVKANYKNFCSNEYFLRYWAKNKKEVGLDKIFDDKLIIEKKFSYKMTQNDIEESMSALVNSDIYYDNSERYPFVCQSYFRKEFLRHVCQCSKVISDKPYSLDPFFTLSSWFKKDSLALNEQLEDDFKLEITHPKTNEVKIIKFQKGSKVIRSIRKICDFLNFSGFEDFCNAHSQILNKKTLSGTMCLSIHPLDYMTMSDNNQDWHTCMSWDNDGEYKQGTVEMMNSPYAIVAYLKSEDTTYTISRQHEPWNSKKWRILLLAHPDCLTSIKAYPYQSDVLTEAALNMLRELYETKLSKKYTKPQSFGYKDEVFYDGWLSYTKVYDSPDFTFGVDFDCEGYMYNDFGCVNHHYICISEDLIKNHEEKEYKVCVSYCGETECIICGNHECIENAAYLACEDCCETHYCAWCREKIYQNDDVYYDDNGEVYHNECYFDNTVEDPIDSVRYWTRDTSVVFLTVDHQTTYPDDGKYIQVADDNINTDKFKLLFGAAEPITFIRNTDFGNFKRTIWTVNVKNLNREGVDTFFQTWYFDSEEFCLEKINNYIKDMTRGEE